MEKNEHPTKCYGNGLKMRKKINSVIWSFFLLSLIRYCVCTWTCWLNELKSAKSLPLRFFISTTTTTTMFRMTRTFIMVNCYDRNSVYLYIYILLQMKKKKSIYEIKFILMIIINRMRERMGRMTCKKNIIWTEILYTTTRTTTTIKCMAWHFFKQTNEKKLMMTSMMMISMEFFFFIFSLLSTSSSSSSS